MFVFNLNTCHIWAEDGEHIAAVRRGEMPEVPLQIAQRFRVPRARPRRVAPLGRLTFARRSVGWRSEAWSTGAHLACSERDGSARASTCTQSTLRPGLSSTRRRRSPIVVRPSVSSA